MWRDRKENGNRAIGSDVNAGFSDVVESLLEDGCRDRNTGFWQLSNSWCTPLCWMRADGSSIRKAKGEER